MLILLTAFTLSCCNNDDDKPIAEIDKLPPATKTGANTVGCLLDGKAFLPENAPNSINCFYQLVSGEYYFALAFNNRDSNNNIIGINIGTNSKQIFQGGEYQLLEYVPNNASATYIFNLTESFTSATNTGVLKITKLDQVNQIVSGTFSFDIQDTNGIIHQIREGRFDMQFTQ